VSYTFLRWVRFGMAASLDGGTLPAGGGPRAQVTVEVNLGATRPVFNTANPMPTAKLAVFGPGDVGGIDARQVIRTFPAPNTADFESSFHAHVEFDRPDLPWLFTPIGPDANNLLRPWLALVVVEKGDDVKIEPASPLPVLAIAKGAAAALPPLTQAAAWAHVQVAGALDAAVDVIARDQPQRILSRLICPRVLAPDKAYFACVVPTYDVGVTAGLGNEVPANAAPGDAWSATADSVRLPVYHHWEFATGSAGDFKSLATRLEAHAPGAGVGTRPLDITTPGFTVADLPAATQVPFGGALCVQAPNPAPVSELLAQRLAPIVNATKAVGPPIYGRWHAAAASVSRAGVPGWLDTLNLDPRYRVAAGLGTRVVQERQEDLMAAVWEQFGELLKANQLLRQAQLAIATAERVVNRHLAPQPDAALLAIAGPALGRIRFSPGKTVRGVVTASCFPLAALSGAFRRIARTHGPLERRFSVRARTRLTDRIPPPAIDLVTLLDRLASGSLNAPAPRLPRGAVAAPDELFPRRRRFPKGRGEPTVLEELMPGFAELARRDGAPGCQPLDLHATTQTVRAAIVPDVAIPPRVRAQITLPNARVVLSNRLDPILAAPEIPTPMIGPLIALGQDYLLPGLGELPPNTLSIVDPDAAFIESYFVGLNHEMGRELLWRGFPTDQRGTVFSRFWDRRGAMTDAAGAPPEADLLPIAGWQRSEKLGTHLTRAASDLVVVLIRGDLLGRYPGSTIYLQRARWSRNAGAIVYDGNVAQRQPVPVTDAAGWTQNARFPVFSGRTGSDLRFMGFTVPRTEVRGLDRTDLPTTTADSEAGWYLVFQEQPTEPRFGSTGAPANPGAQKSEALAATLMRQAFRLFVHASDLVDR
jgi:hypothetical protein